MTTRTVVVTNGKNLLFPVARHFLGRWKAYSAAAACTPAMASGDFSLEDAPASDSDAPASASLLPSSPADEPLTWPARVFAAIVAAGGLFGFVTPSPFKYIVSYYLALFPCCVAFALIIYRLRDSAVSKSFLLGCVFISGVPIILLVSAMELGIMLVGILAILGDSANRLAQEYMQGISDLENATDSISPGDLSPEQKKALKVAADRVWQQIKDQIPLWKILAVIFLMAFLVAAFTEEMAKYLVGRRYRRYTRSDSDSRIGVRGVISCFAASALGFAGSEHIMYATGYVAQMAFFPALWSSVLRALLAFPLHVGTTFWIGTRAAQFAVLKQPVSFLLSISVAIFFHGTLDAMAFLAAAEEISMPMLGSIVFPVQALLVLGIIWLARRSFLQVTAAERQILDAEDFDQKVGESSCVV